MYKYAHYKLKGSIYEVKSKIIHTFVIVVDWSNDGNWAILTFYFKVYLLFNVLLSAAQKLSRSIRVEGFWQVAEPFMHHLLISLKKVQIFFGGPKGFSPEHYLEKGSTVTSVSYSKLQTDNWNISLHQTVYCQRAFMLLHDKSWCIYGRLYNQLRTIFFGEAELWMCGLRKSLCRRVTVLFGSYLCCNRCAKQSADNFRLALVITKLVHICTFITGNC